MRKAFLHLTLLVLLFALPACATTGGSASGPRSKGLAQTANGQPTAQKPINLDKLIASGEIDMLRSLNQSGPGGETFQKVESRVPFKVRHSLTDTVDTEASEITGQATMAWDLQASGPNCKFGGKADGTMKIVSGTLVGPRQCRLRVKIAERWNPLTATGQCGGIGVYNSQALRDESYDLDFPLENNAVIKGNSYINVGEWSEQLWVLKKLWLDDSILCFPDTDIKLKPNR